MRQTVWTAVFALMLLCIVTTTADAAQRFSVKDVDGPTAFAFDGFATVVPPGTTTPVQAPAAAVGRFDADGNGHLANGVRTLVVGGQVFHETFTCTYTVQVNGTGHAECDVDGDRGPQDESFDFVIKKKKDEVVFTSTTPGVTIRGATKRQQ
jgi:hypothetical protein